MAGLHGLFNAIFSTPPDDVPPCVDQANSFREVVSLQALLVTLTVALLAYVRSAPAFDVRVDLLFAGLAALPVMGLCHIVTSSVKTEAGVSLLYWWRQLPGQ